MPALETVTDHARVFPSMSAPEASSGPSPHSPHQRERNSGGRRASHRPRGSRGLAGREQLCRNCSGASPQMRLSFRVAHYLPLNPKGFFFLQLEADNTLVSTRESYYRGPRTHPGASPLSPSRARDEGFFSRFAGLKSSSPHSKRRCLELQGRANYS